MAANFSITSIMARTVLCLAIALFTQLEAVNAQITLETLQVVEGLNAGGLGNMALDDAGDVNGDGFDDYIVGGAIESSGGSVSGAINVRSGFDGSLLFEIFGSQGDRFGTSVAGLGDVNLDGFDDFAASAPFGDLGVSDAGQVLVYSGFDGSVLMTLLGTQDSALFGTTIKAVGDVNLDGIEDLAVASPEEISPTSQFEPKVRVFSGADGSLIHTLLPPIVTSVFGYSIDGGRDVNNDGTNDIIVTDEDNECVHVYSGSTGAFLQTLTVSLFTNTSGFNAALVGDANGDGFGDVAFGAPRSSNAVAFGGAAVVVSGFDGSVLHSVFGTGVQDFVGASVGAAGDLDEDGLDDFLVGSPGADSAEGAVGALRVHSGFDGSLIGLYEGSFNFASVGSTVIVGGNVDGDPYGRRDILLGSNISLDGTQTGGNVHVVTKSRFLIGSDEDFEIRTGINAASNHIGFKNAQSGDALTIDFESPQGAYDLTIPIVALQPFMTGTPITQPMGFPETFVNPSTFSAFPIFVLYNGNESPFGTGLLPIGGSSIVVMIPPVASGISLMIQAFVLAPSANTGNSFFTASDAHHIRF